MPHECRKKPHNLNVVVGRVFVRQLLKGIYPTEPHCHRVAAQHIRGALIAII